MKSVSFCFRPWIIIPFFLLLAVGKVTIKAFILNDCSNNLKNVGCLGREKFHLFAGKESESFNSQRLQPMNMVDGDQDRRNFVSRALKTSALLVSTSFLPKIISPQPVNAMVDAPNLLDIPVQYEGKDVVVKDILGPKATLIVNVASSCALTDGSYKGLVSLYKDYKDKGLEILAFPCNQFGFQEPDEESFIRKDIKRRYGVDFKLYDKIDVNGPSAHPLYKRIKMYEPELSGYGDKIAWNFEKFLVDENGKVVRRYRPGVKPESIIPDVKTLIDKGKLGPARKRSLNEYD